MSGAPPLNFTERCRSRDEKPDPSPSGRAFAACIRAKISAAFMIIIAMIVSSGPVLANYASLIMDASNGRVLHETNADLTRYPASLTKMMTSYLLFEALDRGW